MLICLHAGFEKMCCSFEGLGGQMGFKEWRKSYWIHSLSQLKSSGSPAVVGWAHQHMTCLVLVLSLLPSEVCVFLCGKEGECTVSYWQCVHVGGWGGRVVWMKKSAWQQDMPTVLGSVYTHMHSCVCCHRANTHTQSGHHWKTSSQSFCRWKSS